jgi:hypothetical protein
MDDTHELDADVAERDQEIDDAMDNAEITSLEEYDPWLDDCDDWLIDEFDRARAGLATAVENRQVIAGARREPVDARAAIL